MSKRIQLILLLLCCSAMVFAYFFYIRRPPLEKHMQSEQAIFQKHGELVFSNPDNKEIRKIDIEIADTDYLREKGLMARTSMAENQGMLFIFDLPKIQSFWMKDTILPLDMVFVDAQFTVIRIANDAVPFSEEMISSQEPAQYVVEVNAGFCKKYGIEKGFKIQWKKI